MQSKTSKVALCGVIAALSVVVLFLTGLVPIFVFSFPAIAGCLLIAVVAETSVRYGIAVYAVVSILSVFLVPDREAVLLYIIFFGYYPALYGVLSRIQNQVLCWIVKILLFNVAMLAELFLSVFVLSIPFSEAMPFGKIGVVVIFTLFNLFFVAFDLSMNGLIVMYIRRIHPAIRKYLR